jgi:chromosome segregation ATPase
MIRAFVFACSLAASYELRAGVTPVQKVIQLMNEMHAKGVKEKQDEEVAFTTFKTWCDNTATNKQKAITEAEELMEQFEADIAAAESDVVKLTDEIAALNAEIDSKKAEMASRMEERETEKALYKKTHKDYSESVEATTKAKAVISAQSGDVAQAMMFIQTLSKKSYFPRNALRVLDAYLQGGAGTPAPPEELSVAAPEANAYEFQSAGIVDMLDKLADKFDDQRSDLEKDEMDHKHSYQMLMQQLQDTTEKLKKQLGRKAERKTQRQEDAATAKGELKDTTASRDEDQKYLDDCVAGCQQKSSDFEQRQQLRAEELEAIKKAIEIISGQAVSGAADKHLPGFVQLSSFALRASAMSESQGQVAVFLSTKAEELHSRMLSVLATRAAADPFGKVRKMIKDMIIKLMEEANEETEHKGWCDGELGANKVQRDSKTEDVNTLTAQADQITADIAKLTQELADLATAITELDDAVSKATEIRTTEKAKNEATIADAKAAQEAVKSALAVLKEFYAKAAEATALMQQPSAMDDAPGTFESSFKGQQSESGGVVGMLEVIASDFARLESETTAEEDSASSEYKTFMNDSGVDRATKAAEADNKEKLKTRKDAELTMTKKDLKGAQGELDAALAYYDKLKPSCVDAGVSYEERVARREAEIQSLQEALKILSGEDI